VNRAQTNWDSLVAPVSTLSAVSFLNACQIGAFYKDMAVDGSLISKEYTMSERSAIVAVID
jgi:hypothetical protein